MQSFRFLVLCAGISMLPVCLAGAEESPTKAEAEESPAQTNASSPAPSLDQQNIPIEQKEISVDQKNAAPASPPPSEERRPWYRSASEFLASRSVRKNAPTDVNTKVITDARRIDVSLGKRIPVFGGTDEGLYEGWAIGVDGAMIASLVRYTNEGRLTFATNTFDGTFGLWAGYTNGDGWLAMFRAAHLSAHLVDNSPQILNPISYSQFWNEIIVGKSFPETRVASDWDLHLQGSVGLNNTSTPRSSQPRATVGADFGYAFCGPDSLGLLASADALRAGVYGQLNTYSFFLGLGYLSRPQTTHRPFRAGLVYLTGSDYRNQLYQSKQNWLTFEVATEF